MTETREAAGQLFGPEYIRNPYPIYHRLREEAPVYWGGQAWYLTRYADIVPALRDPRFVASRIHPDAAWLEATGLKVLFDTVSRMMLFTDPPDHTRLRSLASKAFTPRVVEGMRAHIQQIVDDLLNEVEEAGRMDVIRDLAYPLPITVIAELLGVPLEERARFKHWSDHLAAFIGGTPGPEDVMLREALHSVMEMQAYFLDMAARRRAEPRDDLLTALALAEEQGDRLSSDELAANCMLLLVAGHETTTNLIGNGLLALLQNPDQLQLLREQPERIGSAVEELLRYDSPVQGTSRRAAADLQIAGHSIRAGEHVSLLTGAANRDPVQFAAPDRLDITRRENRHLAFGHGPHFCLGAPLARLEGQIALLSLVTRFPRLQLMDEPLQWRDNFTLRGLRTLPVAF